MKAPLPLLVLALSAFSAQADDTKFSTHLHAKFMAPSCTKCHDFFEKDKKGFAFNTHFSRKDPNACTNCHSAEVTGFEHPEEWFAQSGLYTSGMDAVQTCEKTKEALHGKFKSNKLMARQFENHLFNDPRVLWGIEGATPKSGNLPGGKKEEGMIKGGLDEWKAHVKAWVAGGMKCE